MTVTYSLNVANTRLNGFAKLLLRWRGSIYKLLYREMLIFCSLYYSLSLLYRYMLKDDQRKVFEKVALYCEAFTKLIPLSFVLGFYVSIVVNRWWKQYSAIPWPDDLLMMISGYIHGNEERCRIIRRTLARYLLLLIALTFQAISTSVRKRFATLDHLVEAGLMTKEERIAYDDIPSNHGKYWAPAVWFTTLTIRARNEGKIKDDNHLKQILEALYKYRSMAGDLFAYDWISIPLVYTQSVTIAVYTYFSATIMARQYLDPSKGYHGHEIDLYVPIFTFLEFFFFMGWLKVAEQLINPFGEDDDDFELNWILDRNLVVSMIIVDQMHNRLPKLVKDNYWDDNNPMLPYTKSSIGFQSQPYLGSALNLNINLEDSEFIPPSLETIMEDDVNDMISYTSRPNSPKDDLIGLENGVDDVYQATIINANNATNNSNSRRRQTSSISQSALNILPDFFGSRIINMIIGQSSDNVASSLPKTGDKSSSFNVNSLHSSFNLRSPRRRRRKPSATLKSSISSSLFSKASAEDINLTRPNASPAFGRSTLSHVNQQQSSLNNSNQDNDQNSLVIDLDTGQSTPTQYQVDYANRLRFTSLSNDEANLGDKNMATFYANSKRPSINDVNLNDDDNINSVYESDLMDDKSFAQSYSQLPPIAPTTLDRRSLEKDLTINNNLSTSSSSCVTKEGPNLEAINLNKGETIKSMYEPNLSEETLTSESNQSTVTSIAQLLDKNSKNESK